MELPISAPYHTSCIVAVTNELATFPFRNQVMAASGTKQALAT